MISICQRRKFSPTPGDQQRRIPYLLLGWLSPSFLLALAATNEDPRTTQPLAHARFHSISSVYKHPGRVDVPKGVLRSQSFVPIASSNVYKDSPGAETHRGNKWRAEPPPPPPPPSLPRCDAFMLGDVVLRASGVLRLFGGTRASAVLTSSSPDAAKKEEGGKEEEKEREVVV